MRFCILVSSSGASWPIRVRAARTILGTRTDASTTHGRSQLLFDVGEVRLRGAVVRCDRYGADEIRLCFVEVAEKEVRATAGSKGDRARRIHLEHPLAVAERFRITAALELEDREVRSNRTEVRAVLERAFERVFG